MKKYFGFSIFFGLLIATGEAFWCCGGSEDDGLRAENPTVDFQKSQTAESLRLFAARQVYALELLHRELADKERIANCNPDEFKEAFDVRHLQDINPALYETLKKSGELSSKKFDELAVQFEFEANKHTLVNPPRLINEVEEVRKLLNLELEERKEPPRNELSIAIHCVTQANSKEMHIVVQRLVEISRQQRTILSALDGSSQLSFGQIREVSDSLFKEVKSQRSSLGTLEWPGNQGFAYALIFAHKELWESKSLTPSDCVARLHLPTKSDFTKMDAIIEFYKKIMDFFEAEQECLIESPASKQRKVHGARRQKRKNRYRRRQRRNSKQAAK